MRHSVELEACSGAEGCQPASDSDAGSERPGTAAAGGSLNVKGAAVEAEPPTPDDSGLGSRGSCKPSGVGERLRLCLRTLHACGTIRQRSKIEKARRHTMALSPTPSLAEPATGVLQATPWRRPQQGIWHATLLEI